MCRSVKSFHIFTIIVIVIVMTNLTLKFQKIRLPCLETASGPSSDSDSELGRPWPSDRPRSWTGMTRSRTRSRNIRTKKTAFLWNRNRNNSNSFRTLKSFWDRFCLFCFVLRSMFCNGSTITLKVSLGIISFTKML